MTSLVSDYPDAFARVWAALHDVNAGELIVSAAPGVEFADLAGRHHAGGGSHGSLAAGDSTFPSSRSGWRPRSPASSTWRRPSSRTSASRRRRTLVQPERRRRRMVERQLRRRDVEDERVLAAMARVPRELFLPTELRDRAYDDAALPIEGGQTMSQPTSSRRCASCSRSTATSASSTSVRGPATTPRFSRSSPRGGDDRARPGACPALARGARRRRLRQRRRPDRRRHARRTRPRAVPRDRRGCRAPCSPSLYDQLKIGGHRRSSRRPRQPAPSAHRQEPEGLRSSAPFRAGSCRSSGRRASASDEGARSCPRARAGVFFRVETRDRARSSGFRAGCATAPTAPSRPCSRVTATASGAWSTGAGAAPRERASSGSTSEWEEPAGENGFTVV